MTSIVISITGKLLRGFSVSQGCFCCVQLQYQVPDRVLDRLYKSIPANDGLDTIKQILQQYPGAVRVKKYSNEKFPVSEELALALLCPIMGQALY